MRLCADWEGAGKFLLVKEDKRAADEGKAR